MKRTIEGTPHPRVILQDVRAEARETATAMMCASHPRLGEQSPMSLLDPLLLRSIFEAFLRPFVPECLIINKVMSNTKRSYACRNTSKGLWDPSLIYCDCPFPNQIECLLYNEDILVLRSYSDVGIWVINVYDVRHDMRVLYKRIGNAKELDQCPSHTCASATEQIVVVAEIYNHWDYTYSYRVTVLWLTGQWEECKHTLTWKHETAVSGLTHNVTAKGSDGAPWLCNQEFCYRLEITKGPDGLQATQYSMPPIVCSYEPRCIIVNGNVINFVDFSFYVTPLRLPLTNKPRISSRTSTFIEDSIIPLPPSDMVLVYCWKKPRYELWRVHPDGDMEFLTFLQAISFKGILPLDRATPWIVGHALSSSGGYIFGVMKTYFMSVISIEKDWCVEMHNLNQSIGPFAKGYSAILHVQSPSAGRVNTII